MDSSHLNFSQPKSPAIIIPTVLIVDDEPGLLRLFTRLVEKLKCQVLVAGGGAQALDILEQETPDILLLDLAMPEICGLQVLRHIRNTPRLNAMKVMILTARPHLAPYVEELGIDLWLTKPVMPRDFTKIMVDVLADL